MQEYEEKFSGQVHQTQYHTTKEVIKKGITFGSCLAMVISFVTWKSVFWAIIHGFLSWFYVIYYLIKY